MLGAAWDSDTLAETSATDSNPTSYIFFGGKRIARLDPDATTPKQISSNDAPGNP